MPWEGWVKSNSWVYTADPACVFRQPEWDEAAVTIFGPAVGRHTLLQGIFPTQGLNLNLPQWRVDSLPLRQQITGTSALKKKKNRMLQAGMVCIQEGFQIQSPREGHVIG